MRTAIPLHVVCAALFAATAHAQDPDAIETRCAQSMLKAVGKASACFHKEWARAIGLGLRADLTRCEEKLADSHAKAEQRAAAGGGACLAGETAGGLQQALAAGSDKTLTQVVRGTISPAPDACDGVARFVRYDGGNYSKSPKCVTLQPPDLDCTGGATLTALGDSLLQDIACPACLAEEEGCDPRVNRPSLDVEMKEPGICCLKSEPDPRKSQDFLVYCSLCTPG